MCPLLTAINSNPKTPQPQTLNMLCPRAAVSLIVVDGRCCCSQVDAREPAGWFHLASAGRPDKPEHAVSSPPSSALAAIDALAAILPESSHRLRFQARGVAHGACGRRWLTSNSITGTIPPELGSLTSLQSLCAAHALARRGKPSAALQSSLLACCLPAPAHRRGRAACRG